MLPLVGRASLVNGQSLRLEIEGDIGKHTIVPFKFRKECYLCSYRALTQVSFHNYSVVISMDTGTISRPTAIPSLYLLKGLAAFLVVACHTPMGLLGRSIEPIKIIAVPLFFLISGYLLYLGGQGAVPIPEMRSKLSRSLSKLIKTIVVVNIFYYLWVFPKHGNVIDGLSGFIKWIAWGNQVSGHLWYLTAFAEGLIVFYILFSVLKSDRFMYFLPILIIVNLLEGRYSFVHESLTDIYQFDFICYALPYLSLGYLMKKHEGSLLRYRFYHLLILLFLLLSHAEEYWLVNILGKDLVGIFFFSTPLALAIFMLFIQHKYWGQGSFIAHVGKEYSSNIYYFHIAVATVIAMLMSKIGLSSLYEVSGSIWVFIASLIVSWGIVRFQHKTGIKLFA